MGGKEEERKERGEEEKGGVAWYLRELKGTSAGLLCVFLHV